MGRFSCKFWLFSRENRLKSDDCSTNFAFFSHENPAKSADFPANLPLKIPRNFAFFSAKYQKPCLLHYFILGRKYKIPPGMSISGHILPVLWQALQQELSKWMNKQWLLYWNNANSNYAFKSEEWWTWWWWWWWSLLMIKLMTNLECEQILLLSSACALVTHELHTFLLLLQKRA